MYQLSQRHPTKLAEAGPGVMHAIRVNPASWMLLLLPRAAMAMTSGTLKFPDFPQSVCPGDSQQETTGVALSFCNPGPLAVGLRSTGLSSSVLRKRSPWASKMAQQVLAEMLTVKPGDLSSVPQDPRSGRRT